MELDDFPHHLVGKQVRILWSWSPGSSTGTAVTILSPPVPHGWITPGGGWAKSEWAFKARRRNAKKCVLMNLHPITSISEGW